MKRIAIIIGIALLVIAGGWYGYGLYGAGQAAATESAAAQATAQAAAGESEGVIWASGKLLPLRWAALSPAVGGSVRKINAAEGDQVEAGSLLVELDNGVLQSQVDVAAAGVAEAKAARDKLVAGATAADLATVQADLSAAQGALAQAEAALNQARQSADAANSQVAIAEAQYAELASRPSEADKVQAYRQVEVARAAVKQAQGAYDEVRGDPHVAALPQALALEQATINLNAVEAQVKATLAGASRQQLAVAQAQINAARAQVQVAQSQVPSAEAGVVSAKAQVARAQAAVDRVLAGATAEERAMADARVQSAQATLAAAQAQLVQAQVRAPFAGQVGTVHVRPGEQVLLGQPVLVLGDISQMRVETTDLRETDVTRLQVGMPVELTFDALPGRTFEATISRIAPMSSTEKGSTNYTITIAARELDPKLRWGMTAFVNIRAGK